MLFPRFDPLLHHTPKIPKCLYAFADASLYEKSVHSHSSNANVTFPDCASCCSIPAVAMSPFASNRPTRTHTAFPSRPHPFPHPRSSRASRIYKNEMLKNKLNIEALRTGILYIFIIWYCVKRLGNNTESCPSLMEAGIVCVLRLVLKTSRPSLE